MKTLKVIGFLIIAFIGITGGLLRNTEMIPSNAQIDVFPEQKLWLPHIKSVSKYFELNAGDNRVKKPDMLSNIYPSTYIELRNGKYKGFELPQDFDAKSDYAIGYDQSLLWSWLFGKPNRWNVDGSWNY